MRNSKSRVSDRNALTKGSDKSTKQQDKGQGPEEVNTQSREAPQKKIKLRKAPAQESGHCTYG